MMFEFDIQKFEETTKIERFGFMSSADKAKFDSIPTGTLLTKADADKYYMNAENETYVTQEQLTEMLSNFIAGVKVDENGVTLYNGANKAILILPVVAAQLENSETTP